jgi:hypothetical protein
MRLIDADEYDFGLRIELMRREDDKNSWGYRILEAIRIDLKNRPTVDAVPLEPLCELLAEMYHCPSSGCPSSGRACHPGCPDEAFEKLCGTDCDKHTDVERWKAFLTNWMEGLDAKTD